MTIAFVNVLSRYLLGLSLAYMHEISVNLFVWLTLFGAAIAFKNDDHLKVSVLVNRLSPKKQKIINIFGYLVIILFFAVLLYTGYNQTVDEIEMGLTTGAMGIPSWWYTVGLPLGSGLIILRMVWKIYQELSGQPPKRSE